MRNDSVIALEIPARIEGILTAILRQGARELITNAVQAELTDFLVQYSDGADE